MILYKLEIPDITKRPKCLRVTSPPWPLPPCDRVVTPVVFIADAEVGTSGAFWGNRGQKSGEKSSLWGTIHINYLSVESTRTSEPSCRTWNVSFYRICVEKTPSGLGRWASCVSKRVVKVDKGASVWWDTGMTRGYRCTARDSEHSLKSPVPVLNALLSLVFNNTFKLFPFTSITSWFV